MSTRTDVDALVELPRAEREARLRAAAERVETRANRCVAEGRDLTPREDQLIRDDRAELEALMAANAIAEHSERMRSAVATAVETRGSRPEDHAALGDFVEALSHGVPYRALIETRSVTTAVAGARANVAVEAIGRPRWIWDEASIPFFPADSLTVSGPRFAALVARSATAEAGTKPNMTDPTLEQETLAAFAVVEEVSDQVIRFGVGATAVSERLASESVFSVNAAFVAALETAAGTPVTYTTSASHQADAGIAAVWAATGARPTAIIVNPADYPLLSDKAAVGPGDGISTEVLRFNGIALIVSAAVTAGVGVVLNGRAFSAHATPVLLASLPNLNTNMTTLRAETYAALLQHDEAAIVAVDLVTP
ncbi:hypothetical protein QGN32_11635 [Mycolicibacterium sp. ND9-15]|uniref:hypothetical protein n=1 Tax=Mycolicibacterium sp. ND9-15 TaxID=3042320 RepID=UPI002DD9E57E|nr:hypothetical protein [Mycolicibacterium sp. ND9-15]WSE58446.1 hypothetical protein QGN32_11635 [Mycolicibacterium sp. ND9-15]